MFPNVVLAQVVGRVSLKVAAVTAVDRARVLHILMMFEAADGGGGETADLAGEARAEMD